MFPLWIQLKSCMGGADLHVFLRVGARSYIHSSDFIPKLALESSLSPLASFGG